MPINHTVVFNLQSVKNTRCKISLEICLEVWLLLFFKVIFTQKYIKIKFFLNFFLISAHQINLKTSKTYLFKKKFKTQKQTIKNQITA